MARVDIGARAPELTLLAIMCARPHFQAIRFFTNPEGWVASFTGSAIAQRYPRFETGA